MSGSEATANKASKSSNFSGWRSTSSLEIGCWKWWWGIKESWLWSKVKMQDNTLYLAIKYIKWKSISYCSWEWRCFLVALTNQKSLLCWWFWQNQYSLRFGQDDQRNESCIWRLWQSHGARFCQRYWAMLRIVYPMKSFFPADSLASWWQDTTSIDYTQSSDEEENNVEEMWQDTTNYHYEFQQDSTQSMGDQPALERSQKKSSVEKFLAILDKGKVDTFVTIYNIIPIVFWRSWRMRHCWSRYRLNFILIR